jgi:hypothetical protein
VATDTNHTEPAILKLLGWAPLCGRRCESYTVILLGLFFVSYGLWEVWRVGSDYGDLDVMLLSGVAAFMVGLWLVAGLPGRLHKALARLTHRCALTVTTDGPLEETLVGFRRTLERRADMWSRVIALVSAVAVLITFLIASWNQFSFARVALTIGVVVGAYVAGTFLGRMAGYGQFGSILTKCGISIAVTPGHVDGAAGLKPVGDFYFFQAMVVAIPAVFLAVWWFLIPVWPRDYADWREPYVGLLAIAVAIEVFAFLVPLWSFHKTMKARKQALQTEADKLCVKINEIQRKLMDESSSDEKTDLREQLTYMTDQFRKIERMPTWPVDTRTRRLFGMNNVLLLTPLIGRLTKHREIWDEIFKVIKNFQI